MLRGKLVKVGRWLVTGDDVRRLVRRGGRPGVLTVLDARPGSGPDHPIVGHVCLGALNGFTDRKACDDESTTKWHVQLSISAETTACVRTRPATIKELGHSARRATGATHIFTDGELGRWRPMTTIYTEILSRRAGSRFDCGLSASTHAQHNDQELHAAYAALSDVPPWAAFHRASSNGSAV